MNRFILFAAICFQSYILCAQNITHAFAGLIDYAPVGSYLLPNGNFRLIYVTSYQISYEETWLVDIDPAGQIIQQKILFNSGVSQLLPIKDGNAMITFSSNQCDFFQYLGFMKIDSSGNLLWSNSTYKPQYDSYLFQINQKQIARANQNGMCWPIDLETGQWAAQPQPLPEIPKPFIYQGSFYYTTSGSILRKHQVQDDALVVQESMPGIIRDLVVLSNGDIVFTTGPYMYRVNSNLLLQQVIQTNDELQRLVATENGGFLTTHYYPTHKIKYYNQSLELLKEVLITDPNIKWFEAKSNKDVLFIAGYLQTNKNTAAFSLNTSLEQPDIQFYSDVALTEIVCLDTVRILTDTGYPPFIGNYHRANYGDARVTIKNLGPLVLDSVAVGFRMLGCPTFCTIGTERLEVFRNLNLEPGQSTNVMIKDINTTCFRDTMTDLCLWLVSPNGDLDKNQSDNLLCTHDFITTIAHEPTLIQFEITPNPTHGIVRITLNPEYGFTQLLEIFDAFGRLVKQELHTAQAEIFTDLSSLPQGNYILKLKTENGIGIQKVSVAH
jgi:hypothetical protein